MQSDSLRKHFALVKVAAILRILIPLTGAFLGVVYVLFDPLILQHRSLSVMEIVRITWFPLLICPIIFWIMLAYLVNAAKEMTDEQMDLAYQIRELSALNAIGETAGLSLDLETVLHAALQTVVEHVDIQAGGIWVIEDDRLILKASVGTTQIPEEHAIPLGQCLCGKCARTGDMVALNDLTSDLSMRNTPCALEGFRSVITLPLKTKAERMGVILLGSSKPNIFGPADQRILTAIGVRVSLALENTRLYRQLHRRTLHLETASFLGQRVSSLLDLDSLLADAVKIIREAFGYYHVQILLVEEHTRELVLKGVSGPNAEAMQSRGLRLRIETEGITGWVAHSGQTHLCNDVLNEPRYLPVELVPDTRSELAVPLRVGDRTMGVLDVQSDRRNAFDQEDRTVMQILGNQIGIAIQSARLFEETKQRYEAMAALHETSLDITGHLETKDLLGALLQRGTQLLGARAGVFYTYDASQAIIHTVASYNTWKDWAGVTLHPGEGVVGEVIRTGEPLIVNDYHNWPQRASIFETASETRIIGVPLKWEGQIIGVVDILNRPENRPFNNGDIWLLSQFADLASIAIKNAQLHSQITQFSQELEQKVNTRTRELSEAKEELAARSEQLHRLFVQTIRAQEDERARIARDMHDDVVQLITAARLELDAAEIAARPALKISAQEKLRAARGLLDEMEKQIRRTIHNLHPPSLDAVGLHSALQNYVHRFSRISGIDCQMKISGPSVQFPVQAESNIYRMVAEALSNIAAHAEATQVVLALDYQPSSLCIAVRDNGRGFDQQQWRRDSGRNGQHLGLLGMQERAESLGGRMNLVSALGRGTQLVFEIPFGKEQLEWTRFVS